MNEWIWLFFAIIFEVLGTSFLKLSDGFTKLVPSLVTTISYIASFYCLSIALKRIDISVAYAIWGALGIALISVIGISYFGEKASLLRIICFILIIVGTAGLKLSN